MSKKNDMLNPGTPERTSQPKGRDPQEWAAYEGSVQI